MNNYETKSDGFITQEENLEIQEPHFAPGFTVEDKPYLQGYCAGLELAIRFCDEEQDPRVIRRHIEDIIDSVAFEKDWLI